MEFKNNISPSSWYLYFNLPRPSPRKQDIQLLVFGLIQLDWARKISTLCFSHATHVCMNPLMLTFTCKSFSNLARCKIILSHYTFFNVKAVKLKSLSLFFLHNIFMAMWWMRWQCCSLPFLCCCWCSHMTAIAEWGTVLTAASGLPGH